MFIYRRNSEKWQWWQFSVVSALVIILDRRYCSDKTNHIKSRRHLELFFCIYHQRNETCHTWVFSWAFSWSGLVARRLWICIFTQAEKMLCEWVKSTVILNPPTTAAVKVFCLLQWTFPRANCGERGCVRILLGVNGNQQHIHTSSSPELKLWLSEHLSDHCEIANSLSLCLLFVPGPCPNESYPTRTPPQSVTPHEVTLTGRGYK